MDYQFTSFLLFFVHFTIPVIIGMVNWKNNPRHTLPGIIFFLCISCTNQCCADKVR